MLTPAEELGLSGLNVASRVRKAFLSIPDSTLKELMHGIHDEALRRRVVYRLWRSSAAHRKNKS